MARDPNWLIDTKFMPPRIVGSGIERPSLIAQLEVAPGRVILVRAAAGYGKSTLLGQWRSAAKDRGVLVAWLSLDEGDREIGEFLAYVSAALHRTGISAETDRVLAASSTPSSPRAVLAAALNLIGQCDRPLAIVLDDYHRAASPDNDRFMAALIDRMPPNLTLVLASRNQPDIPLSKVKAEGRLVTLNAADLRFSDPEIREFFQGAPGIITADQVSELSARTDGWPVLLQFARFWFSGGGDPKTLLDVSAHDIEAYLSEQIFDQLPADIRRFLLLTSPLETVSAPLAAAIGIPDAARALGALVRLPLPVSPVDGRRNVYRIHHLLRSYLMDRASDEGVDLDAVHLRAAGWFAAEGRLASAVRHAMAAGASRLAGDILDGAGGWRLIYHRYGHLGPIIRTVHEGLPPDAEGDLPRLTLGAAILRAKSGDLDGAKRIFDRIAARPALAPAILAEVKVVGSLLQLYRDEFGGPNDGWALSSAFDDIALDDTVHAAIASNMISFKFLETGEYHQARHYGVRAIDYFRRSEAVFGEIHLYAHIGQAAFCTGLISEAAATYETMRALSVSHIGQESDLHAIASILSAEIMYEEDDLASARDMVGLSLGRIEKSDSWLDVLAAGYVTAARLAYHDDGIEAALDVLDRAEGTAHRRGYLRLHAVSALERTRLLTFCGRRDAARHALAEASDLVAAMERSGRPLVFRGDSPAILAARLALGDGRPADALAMLATDAGSRSSATVSRRITVEILTALAEHGLGRDAQRDDALRAALRLSVGEPFTRLYLDEGPAIAALVQAAAEGDVMDRDLRRVAERLFAPRPVRAAPSALPSHTTLDLSHREQAILTLIAEGLSNKEIARSIVVGPDAVKYHAKKLFAKLGVQRRTLAVAKARHLGLVV